MWNVKTQRWKNKHDSIEFATKSHTTKCFFVYFICFVRYFVFFLYFASKPMTTTATAVKKMQIVKLCNWFVTSKQCTFSLSSSVVSLNLSTGHSRTSGCNAHLMGSFYCIKMTNRIATKCWITPFLFVWSYRVHVVWLASANTQSKLNYRSVESDFLWNSSIREPSVSKRFAFWACMS